MAKNSDTKVHLDHLIPRESLRWVEPQQENYANLLSKRTSMTRLPYKDLADRGEMMPIFQLLRKPDFQRETSAWSPKDCVYLLESIINGLIIPSLIVWKSPENNFLYILDGAHRISVMRAWILDDWGDKAPEDYYERHEYHDEIRQSAQIVRDLVKANIGSYEDFSLAGKEFLEASKQGSPREALGEKKFARGVFFMDIIQEAGFHIQEVAGNYEVAEASFLRINQSGQPLDDWEKKLIANRNSSFARAVMSVANAGAGRYWPASTNNAVISANVQAITQASSDLHKLLFVPPIKTPIHDANVPFMPASKYFPKHAYLLELFPVIMKTEDAEGLFARDKEAPADIVMHNGQELMERTTAVFSHLTGDSNNPLSLSLVPLFYFYTDIGRYVRSSLYGFLTWIMSGNDETIRTRKVIFSAHRGRFEQVIFANDIAGAITRRFGSGTRATDPTMEFYQRLLEVLVEDPSSVEGKPFHGKLTKIMSELTTASQRPSEHKGRVFTTSQKNKINLREIFKSAIRCDICGGVLDLRLGVQYDHIVRFAESRRTDATEGRPTHPFCNNQRDAIEAYRRGTNPMKLPAVSGIGAARDRGYQLSLFDMFSNTTFPDEEEAS